MFKYDFDKHVMSNTQEWCNEGINPAIDSLQEIPMEGFMKEWINKHIAGENIIVDDVNKLNKDGNLYQILYPQDIISLIVITLINKDELIGFVGFDSVKNLKFEETMKLLYFIY